MVASALVWVMVSSAFWLGYCTHKGIDGEYRYSIWVALFALAFSAAIRE